MSNLTSRTSMLIAFAMTLCATSYAHAAPTVLTEWPSIGAGASSSLWPAANLVDGNANTVWSSNIHSEPRASESLVLSLAAMNDVNFIKFGTRYDGQTAYSFPVDFTISTWDGAAWNKAITFSHYPRPNQPWLTVRLPETVRTQYVRVETAILSKDDQPVNNYVFQLSELIAGFNPSQPMAVTYTPNTATGSTNLWPASSVFDGDPNSVWSSNTHAAPAVNEAINFAWPEGIRFTNYVKLLPRYFNGVALGFPTDFTVYYKNNITYTRALTVTNFTPPPRPVAG